MDLLDMVFYLCIFDYLYFKIRYTKVNGPPLYYFFPFLGVVPFYVLPGSLFRPLWRWYLRNLPDVILGRFFWYPVLFVKNSGVIEVQKNDQCLGRASHGLEKAMGYVMHGKPFWFVYDNNSCDWRSTRKTNILAMNILPRVQKFERVAEVTDHFLKTIEEQKGRLWDYEAHLTFAKVQEATNVNLGDTFDSDDIWAFVRLVHKLLKNAVPLLLLYCLPLGVLELIQPFFPKAFRLGYLKRRYAKITSGLLQMKMKEIDEPRDFVEAVLTIREPEAALSFIKETGFFNMVASSHTTQHTTMGALSYISLDGRIQKKIHEELDRVVGQSPLKYDHLASLHYLKAAIHETSRMTPPVPMVAKVTSEAACVAGYTVESNMKVTMFLNSEGADPEKFHNPDDFIPERFIKENGVFEASKDFNIFSRGKRACPGADVATLSALVYCAKILQHFHISPENADVEMLGYSGSVLGAPTAIPLRFVRREGAPDIRPVPLKTNLSAFFKKEVETDDV